MECHINHVDIAISSHAELETCAEVANDCIMFCRRSLTLMQDRSRALANCSTVC
jgi:hypothetical protein